MKVTLHTSSRAKHRQVKSNVSKVARVDVTFHGPHNNQVLTVGTDLLLGDVDGFVEDHPRHGFMAGWHCRRPVVRHVVLRFGQ